MCNPSRTIAFRAKWNFTINCLIFQLFEKRRRDQCLLSQSAAVPHRLVFISSSSSRRWEPDLTKEFKARSRATPRSQMETPFALRRRDTKEPVRASIDSLPVYIFSVCGRRVAHGNDPLFRSLEFLLTHYAGARSTSAGPYFIFRNGGPATGENRYRFDRSPLCPGTSGTIGSPN